jgi:hypothetical protein
MWYSAWLHRHILREGQWEELYEYFYTSKCIFWVGMSHGYAGMFPGKEGGIQVLAVLAPFSQTIGSLFRTPAACKAGWKNVT